MGKWEDRLLTERPGAKEQSCVVCARTFWVPPSKVGQRSVCSEGCLALKPGLAAKERGRECETCGAAFVPRRSQLRVGQGRFCSQRCNTAAREVLSSPESLAYAASRVRELRAAGLLKYPRGEENKQWRGGPAASRLRRRLSGDEAATLRRYRKANPDKVREFSQRRKDRKLSRLPRGTLPAIRARQKGRCAICRTLVRGAGHFDHIVPLARGGVHEPRNLQLLCAPCNLTKNARDPLEHMRSLGRLL